MANTHKELGTHIQQLRQKARLTQDELSDRANLAYSTLAKIERGAIKNPSVFTVAALADALGTTVERLVQGSGPHRNKRSSRIKFFYSDINGVLVRFFQKAFVNLAKDYNLNVEKVETAFWHYNDAANRGEISPQDFNKALCQRLKIKQLDWEQYYIDTVEAIKPMHDALPAIQKTVEVGLLSNINQGMIDKMLKLGLLPKANYTAIVDSSEVGAIKPEPKIYQIAETMAGYAGEEILFADDSRTNLMAAQRFGWHVLWFDDYRPQESVDRIKEALDIR